MAIELRLPDVGEGLAEAEIVRWLVQPGEAVVEDQAIVEVETDKAVVEIPSPVTGTLVRHGGDAGDVLPIGALLAELEDGSDAPGEPDAQRAPGGAADPAARRVLATPATRGLARELGVDLAALEGTGPGGRVVDDDVRAAASTSADSPAAGEPPATPREPAAPRQVTAPAPPSAAGRADERIPLRGVRRAIATRLTRSWQQVPHVTSVHEVDLSELLALRARLAEADRPVPLTAFLVKAVALALRRWPTLNATVDEQAGEIVVHGRIHLAVSVDTEDGLLVPVIRDADVTPVARIGRDLGDLARRAQARRLGPDEQRGATFTVNNYGPLGGWFGTSLVSPGQVGICSLGPARDRVVPVDGEISIRPIAVLTLGADHRVADGRELIGFCLSVRELLESPVTLLVED